MPNKNPDTTINTATAEYLESCLRDASEGGADQTEATSAAQSPVIQRVASMLDVINMSITRLGDSKQMLESLRAGLLDPVAASTDN